MKNTRENLILFKRIANSVLMESFCTCSMEIVFYVNAKEIFKTLVPRWGRILPLDLKWWQFQSNVHSFSSLLPPHTYNEL